MTRALLLAPLALLVACGSPVSVEPVLAIVHISPSGGAAQVAVDTDVVITFNHALDGASVTSSGAWLEDATGAGVPAELTWSAETLSLTLDPMDELEPSSTYVVSLGTELWSEEAGSLAALVQSDFSTEGDTTGNLLPVADAGPDQQVDVGVLVQLDGSASYDPEGEAVAFEWWIESLPGASAAMLDDASVADPSFVADAEGEYILGLVVDDGQEESSPDYVTIEATEAP